MKHEIKLFIINNPGMADKAVALTLGVSISHVNRLRREMMPEKAIGGRY